MLTLISPSKSLDFKSDARSRKKSEPKFVDGARELVNELRQLSATDISSLMNINQDLSQLNANRYQSWSPERKGGRQSILAFKGGVYFGLEAWSFTEREFTSAQRRIRILSGLYGLLKPLDVIHPYRLEMGLPFASRHSDDLYGYWRERVTSSLEDELASHRNPILVNCASREYFNVIDEKRFSHDVIHCEFLDNHNGQLRFMSFYGKKARGLMARHIVLNKIETRKGLREFNLEGYRYSKERSTPSKYVFVREHVPATSAT